MEEEKRSPLVSIIMPVWNQEELVIRALDSIPDRDDLEVLCINDGSTDRTWEVLNDYKRLPNLRLFNNEVNMGIGLTRNVGFDNAIGHWLYGLDSDDAYDTEKFNLVVDNLPKFEDYDIVHVHLIDNKGNYWRYPGLCAFHTYFMKRELLGDIRCPQKNYGEDRAVLMTMRALKHPKEITITEPVFYLYNNPRENSATDLFAKGIRR